MSEPVSTQPASPADPPLPERSIRPARGDDVAAIVGAVEDLLEELGGSRPSPEELEAEVWMALRDPAIGALIVAEAGGAIVGLISASWQRALHVPGLYVTVQDLWVRRDWRSHGVGAELVEALATLAGEQGVARIEVGLPRESFAAIEATEAFYRDNGFEHLGPRMRRLLG
jgi:GNAT superfamily N-acetyltransferase